MENRKVTAKQWDNYNRLKYRRELERFLNRVVSITKDDSIKLESFKIKIDEFYNKFIKVEPTTLNNRHFENIEKFLQNILNRVDSISQDEFGEFKNLILRDANVIQKEKNQNNYKKDKYKNQAMNDGW